MTVIIPSREPVIRNYYVAATSEEALSFLSAHHGHAQVVAGGTLLMPQMQRHESYASKLVDVSRVGSMRTIVEQNGHLIMGGAVTFGAMLGNALIREKQPLLYEAAQLVGTPKVRHLGTIGGNVASATGSAEGLLALVALGAEAEIDNLTGEQWLPVERLCVRCGVSRLDSMSEILTRLRFPSLQAQQGAAMAHINGQPINERAPLALALLVTLEPDLAVVNDCRVALGTSQGIPQRVQTVESELIGQTIADARLLFHQFATAWLDENQPDVATKGTVTALLTQSFDHAVEIARRPASDAPNA